MRNIFLVALREFTDNVRTKGFWLGILAVPVLATLGVTLGNVLEKSKPTRDFVFVDPSGKFEGAVDQALDRLHEREVLEAFGQYVRDHADPSKLAGFTEQADALAAGLKPGFVDRFQRGGDEALQLFRQAGGIDAMLAAVKGVLEPNAPSFQEPRRAFRRVDLPPDIDAKADLATIASQLKPYLRGKRSIQVDGQPAKLFAAVLVPSTTPETIPPSGGGASASSGGGEDVQYWSVNLADDDLSKEIQSSIDEEVRRRAFLERGVDQAQVREIQDYSVPFVQLDPEKQAGAERVGLADKIMQWAPVGFVYFLWLAVFTVAQMLLNNMIEEKSNRLVEVLLSSVTPSELMLGKLFGIAAVGLTLVGAWVVYLIGFLQAKSDAQWAIELLKVLKGTGLVPMFLLYFSLGYLLYAAVFLTIGSLCNTLKEAQSLMMPIIVVMIVPLITMEFIPREPNGTIARVLSWIPIYTPFVMMNRAAANPPLVDRIGTLVLLVATTLVVLSLCGRIFRVGILRTGQPPKLLEIVRWARNA